MEGPGPEAVPGDSTEENAASPQDSRDDDGPLAKVIPMPIFDPFAEADKRW